MPEVDAALERVILQCLERDPKRRPDSAYAVAAALPGGDPLALALAAGETPSPSMVAAAGGPRRVGSSGGRRLPGVALLALFFVVRLADRTFFLPQAGLEKSPAVLADKAEQIIATLGREPAARSIGRVLPSTAATCKYAVARETRSSHMGESSSGRPPAVCFWYRAGGDQIALPALLGNALPARVFPTEPGMVTVRLDGRGRLLQYV